MEVPVHDGFRHAERVEALARLDEARHGGVPLVADRRPQSIAEPVLAEERREVGGEPSQWAPRQPGADQGVRLAGPRQLQLRQTREPVTPAVRRPATDDVVAEVSHQQPVLVRLDGDDLGHVARHALGERAGDRRLVREHRPGALEEAGSTGRRRAQDDRQRPRMDDAGWSIGRPARRGHPVDHPRGRAVVPAGAGPGGAAPRSLDVRAVATALEPPVQGLIDACGSDAAADGARLDPAKAVRRRRLERLRLQDDQRRLTLRVHLAQDEPERDQRQADGDRRGLDRAGSSAASSPSTRWTDGRRHGASAGAIIVESREDRVRSAVRHQDRDLAAAGSGFVHAGSLARPAWPICAGARSRADDRLEDQRLSRQER